MGVFFMAWTISSNLNTPRLGLAGCGTQS